MQIHIYQALRNSSNVLSIQDMLKMYLHPATEKSSIDSTRMDLSFLMLLAGNDYIPGLTRVSFPKILKNFQQCRLDSSYKGIFIEDKGDFGSLNTQALVGFLSTLVKKGENYTEIPWNMVQDYWEGLIWHYGIHRGWIVPHEPHHYFMPLLPYSYKRSFAMNSPLPRGSSKPVAPWMLLKFIKKNMDKRVMDIEQEVRQLDSKWKKEFEDLCQGSPLKPSPELSSLLVSLYLTTMRVLDLILKCH
jgi:hypothetical protein